MPATVKITPPPPASSRAPGRGPVVLRSPLPPALSQRPAAARPGRDEFFSHGLLPFSPLGSARVGVFPSRD